MPTASQLIIPAPIILFVYARPQHTQQTLAALSANSLASQSDLIIFSDEALDEAHRDAVADVRTLCRQATGFRSVEIILRNENYGLARNIIEGLTEISHRYDQFIVLEDDIVTSPGFLTFMNQALQMYANEPGVWHISGWNYPISPIGLPESFLWRTMNCWGWATWSNRWQHFSKNPTALINNWDANMIRAFNLDNSYAFWDQVIANQEGKLNTWAVFWYATLFQRKGLCLNPTRSLVHNIGFDASGEHCTTSDPFSSVLANEIDLEGQPIQENPQALLRIQQFLQQLTPSLPHRIASKLRRLLLP